MLLSFLNSEQSYLCHIYRGAVNNVIPLALLQKFILYGFCYLLILEQAQAIGKAASDFIQEELKMDYVYDYMFHLLNEYDKLLRFEPQLPKGTAHLCSKSMACPTDESPKKSMTESLVKSPSVTDPCTMPPPYEPRALAKLYMRNINSITQVQQCNNGKINLIIGFNYSV